MASTSAPQGDSGSSRIRSAASTIRSDNQTLFVDIRQAMKTMKEIAVDLERQRKTQKVKEVEAAYMELLEAYLDCDNLSSAVESVGDMYQPREQLTDFEKLLDNEMAKSKRSSSRVTQKNQLLRQFREALWNVHNPGQPMPGDEQEDIIMTSTQNSLLNITCPLSGKPVTELSEPVRSLDCKHIYEKQVIMNHIRSNRGRCKCPISACPNTILAERVICDPLLPIEIDEWRSMKKQADRNNTVEDFTKDAEEEEESD